MRAAALIVALAAASPAAAAQSGHDAFHGAPMTAWFAGLDLDAAETDDGARLAWDATAWIGGDAFRAVLRSEGHAIDGAAEEAELQLLGAWPVSEFFDLRAGARATFAPEDRTALALGVAGLAPYFIETEAMAFVDGEGVQARLHLETDWPVTPRLILSPRLELEAASFERDGAGEGLIGLEAGLRLRYQVTRRLAPYIECTWERALGETALRTRAAGEDASETVLRVGVRIWI